MTQRARQLVEATRADLRTVEERLTTHPYPAAVEAGTLPRQQLRAFAGQQHRIITSDLRSVGLMIQRYGDGPSGQFFVDGLATEVAALAALEAFGGAVGLDPDALAEQEPLPGALAYTHFIAWLAAYGSDAEFAAAFLVNLPAWGKNCARMAAALRHHYSMDDRTAAFFDLFAADAPGYEAAALHVIELGLARGVQPQAIRNAARLLQTYELMFWDAVHVEAFPKT